MAIILPVPVDPADGPAAPDLEDSARRAFGLDEGDARSDAEARLASRVLLTVLGILFALACLALLLALVNWGKP